jgi:hypothetical protein
LVWLFGLVKKDLFRKKIKAGLEDKKKEVKKKPGDRNKFTLFLRILRIEGVLNKITRFIKEVIFRLQIKHIRANLTLGFENPADTGILFAWLYPANYILRNLKFYDVNLQPSFAGDLVFEGSLQSTIRVHPVRFMAPIAKLLFSTTTIRVIRTITKRKWKES